MRLLTCLLIVPTLFAAEIPVAPKPMGLTDILAWKRIQGQVVSDDGRWFAYRLAPNEGDSEVVIRDLKSSKDLHFPSGELPMIQTGSGGAQPGPAPLAISGDSKWAAFAVYPTAKEGKALKKAKKPAETKAVLVELATGNKTEFERIRRFSFSGKRSTTIALQRYSNNPPAPPDATGPDNRPQGSDVILRELASGNDLSLGNVSDFAFTKNGDWLAWVVDAQDQAGNGVNVRNLETGAVFALESGKATYKGLNWTEKGDALAVLRGVEDKTLEDKPYSLVAFRNFSRDRAPEKISFDPAKDASFPKGMSISPNRNPAWMADLSAVTFGIHELKAKKKGEEESKDAIKKDDAPKPETAKKDEPDLADLSIWHWKDAHIQPMQQVDETRDKNFSYLSAYLVADQKFVRLADPSLREVRLLPDYRSVVGIDKTAYELEESLSGNEFVDVYTVDPKTGSREKGLSKAALADGIFARRLASSLLRRWEFLYVRGSNKEDLQHHGQGGRQFCGHGGRSQSEKASHGRDWVGQRF